jgi:predicted Zn-dependent protease
MALAPWNLEQLKSQLSQHSRINSWVVTEEHVHRRERYFLMDGKALAVDQDRNTHSKSTYVRIFVNVGKPGRQGETTKKLSSLLPLSDQIESAIESALQTDLQAWTLPQKVPTDVPQLASADPRMAEDLEKVMGELSQKIAHAVSKKRSTAFNSAELFLSLHDRELHLSSGLTHRSSQSRIYVEAAYSMTKTDSQGKSRSDEYLNTQWSVHLDDLSIDKLFDETSERAEHSLDVIKPETGKYPVIIDAEVLATLLNGQISQLSAVNSYNRLPFVKPGDELIPQATGDLLSITLDPSLPFGGDTAALSEQGVIQKPLQLVEKNRVVATSTDKQYADYLSAPVTTVRGNVVVAPGTLSHEELTKQQPKVLEILQFSGLFSDSNSGTFSSEIRLAKLYDNVQGKVTYLKGGSLSGSITENFRGARLSRNQVKRSHFSTESSQGHGYYGPDYALLSDVSIVG